MIKKHLRAGRWIALVSITVAIGGCRCNEDSTPFSKISQEERITVASAEFSTEDKAPILELQLEVPRDAVLGWSVPIRVILTNPGGTTVNSEVSSELPHTVTLVQPDGSPAQLTDYGKTQLGPRNLFSVSIVSFDGGASKVWNIDLHKIFQFSQLGWYSLDVAQEVTYWNGTAKQDTVIGVKHLRFRLDKPRS